MVLLHWLYKDDEEFTTFAFRLTPLGSERERFFFLARVRLSEILSSGGYEQCVPAADTRTPHACTLHTYTRHRNMLHLPMHVEKRKAAAATRACCCECISCLRCRALIAFFFQQHVYPCGRSDVGVNCLPFHLTCTAGHMLSEQRVRVSAESSWNATVAADINPKWFRRAPLALCRALRQQAGVPKSVCRQTHVVYFTPSTEWPYADVESNVLKCCARCSSTWDLCAQ